MNGLDIAIIIVLFFFFLRGIFRGFIKEIIGIIGLALGFFLANKYYPALADQLKPFIQHASYRQAIGFQVVFLVAFFIISLVGLLLDKLVKLTISAVSNGIFGAVIGLVKGVVLSAIILMATTAFIRPDASFFKDSATWPYMRELTESFRKMVPEDLQQALANPVEKLPAEVKPEIPGPGPEELDEKEPPPWKMVTPEAGETPPPSWPGGTDQQ
ncbi:MAG: CvpA family protein [Thermodesulfobacteriota bacterium]